MQMRHNDFVVLVMQVWTTSITSSFQVNLLSKYEGALQVQQELIKMAIHYSNNFKLGGQKGQRIKHTS